MDFDLVEHLVKIEDLPGIDLLIREYQDKEEILILLMDSAFMFDKFKVVKHLYSVYNKNTVSEEIIIKIRQEYPEEYVERIRMLIIEMDLEKISLNF
jgi:hypothetical protein